MNHNAIINRMLIGGTPMLLSNIIAHERQYGVVVLPGEAPWFDARDWHDDSLCSTDGSKVRMVLLRATKPNSGALKRMIDAIVNEGMQPVIVEPLGLLADKCREWGWKSRRIGAGDEVHTIWYPR